MAWYEYDQNNSGGRYYGPEVIYVQANSAEEADMRAVEFCDVYFDGVETGSDCDCCGDRWHNAYSEMSLDDIMYKLSWGLFEEGGTIAILSLNDTEMKLYKAA